RASRRSADGESREDQARAGRLPRRTGQLPLLEEGQEGTRHLAETEVRRRAARRRQGRPRRQQGSQVIIRALFQSCYRGVTGALQCRKRMGAVRKGLLGTATLCAGLSLAAGGAAGTLASDPSFAP